MYLSKLSLRRLLAAISGLLCTTLMVSAEVQQGAAVVKAVSGTASYLDELGASHPLTSGAVLKAGYTVKTGADSSVDLFLDQNGPGVGLNANSTLLLERLTYERSILGTLIDTKLDL